MVFAHNTGESVRTRDIQISQDVTFGSMFLSENTLEGLKRSGFYKPSPVQLHGIPLGKCGFDLLLEAKSGTGKTAVFSVIALEKLELDKGLQVVILAPTREIAFQIYDVIKQLGMCYPELIVEVVMGGLPVIEDIAKFKKNVQIVVGSPGRLRHLIQDRHIDLSAVRLLVLDEADKLMEKSFLNDINYIFSMLPKEKQVIMSSATYPEATKSFINKYVKCAQHVCPDSNCILLGVEQKHIIVKYNSNIVRQTQLRFEELLKILSKKQFKQCLIFCNYQVRVNELYKLLKKEKWPVEQLSGQQDQSDRLEALKTLQEYKCRILISTDLAARGIDASNVDLVINFEPPLEWQTYLHRIGRAGRYGSYGMAISILSEKKEEEKFKKMLELINLDNTKIGSFWSDENNTVDLLRKAEPGAGVVTSNVTYEKNKPILTKFWNELLIGNEIVKEIEDFEILCKSFEKLKNPEIQSFTDLLNSFNTCKEIGIDDSVYQTLRIKSEPINNDIKTVDAFQNDNDLTKKEELLKTVTNGINESPVETSSCKQNKNKWESKTCDRSQEEFNICIKNDIQFSNMNSDFETETSNRALIDAGLPLCFGNSKRGDKGTNKMRKLKIEQSNDSSISTRKYKDRVKNIPREETSNHCKTQEYTAQKAVKKLPHIQTKKNYKENTKTHVTSSYGSYQVYRKWYEELKMKVNQIQLAFYMDEITKL